MMRRDTQLAMQDIQVKSAYHAPAVSALLQKHHSFTRVKKISIRTQEQLR
jgi:hypothetical protein